MTAMVPVKSYVAELTSIYGQGMVLIKAEKVDDLVAINYGTRDELSELRGENKPKKMPDLEDDE